MSYKGITERARDSNRISTLKELEKGLSIFKEKTGNYPTPEGKIYTGVLSLSGYVDYSYVGIVGENISNQLKLNGVPLDPLSNTNYIYATNINKTSYQIATVLEVLQAYKKPEQNMKFDKGELCLIQKTYANSSSYKAKVLGTHKENVKIENGGKTWLTTVPSMIFDPTVSSGNILNSSGSYLIVNKGKNLPYKLNSNDTTANQNGNEIMQVLRENTNAKIATIDITEIVNKTKTVEQVFGTGGENNILSGITSKEILSSFGVKEEDLGNTSAITSKMETIITGQTSTSQSQIPSTPTYSNCTLSGETINHGSSITTYNETSILWNATYNCDNRKITRTCNNGTLSGDSSYEYTSCIKGTVNNCSASGSYVNNGHIYSIPAISHNTSTGNILSSNFSENNGTFKYTLTSIECNDGSYTNITENPTPTIQSCNSGYGINGNICSASQNGVCNNSIPLGCTTGSGINDNGQTACETTRTWNCNGLYGGSNSVQCSKANAVCTVSGSCTGIIANAVYYGDVTSYSLVNAPNGTSLTGSYLATPTENTCQYKCATNYTWGGSSCVLNRGEQVYTTPGTYTWTVPAGVTSVSVVCVGGGGQSNGLTSGPSGGTGRGGGGLGYKNNYSIIPGNTYVVSVGNIAQDSFFISTSIIKGGGASGQIGGLFNGDGGGNGGNGGGVFTYDTYGQGGGGGGGAGGYSGNGGNGGIGGNARGNYGWGSAGTFGAGGGGGGAGGSGYGSAGGGGVGLYGQGSNGVNGTAGAISSSVSYGGAGSNGSVGINNTGNGGLYGGGSGSYGNGGPVGVSGNGACRIVRPGTTRQFPSTDVGP